MSVAHILSRCFCGIGPLLLCFGFGLLWHLSIAFGLLYCTIYQAGCLRSLEWQDNVLLFLADELGSSDQILGPCTFSEVAQPQ